MCLLVYFTSRLSGRPSTFISMATPLPTPPPTQPGPPTQLPGRRSRRNAQYTLEERAVLRQYKAAYKETATHQQRENLLRNELLPAIHNYWYELEKRNNQEPVLPSAAETQTRNKVRYMSVIGHYPSTRSFCFQGPVSMDPQ